MNPPGEPTGNSPMVSWLRRLREFCLSLRIQPGVGYRIASRGPGGTVLKIQPPAGGGGGGATRYKLDSVGDDYLVVHTWDGTTEGTEDIGIAKSYKLRHTITQATIDGVYVTYTYSTVADNLDKKRVATDNTITEEQYVTPRWLDGDEIFAIEAQTGIDFTRVTGTVTEVLDCTKIDLNLDGRAWAAEY